MGTTPQAKQPGPVFGSHDRAGEKGMHATPKATQLQKRIRPPLRVLILEMPRKTQSGMLLLLSIVKSLSNLNELRQ